MIYLAGFTDSSQVRLYHDDPDTNCKYICVWESTIGQFSSVTRHPTRPDGPAHCESSQRVNCYIQKEGSNCNPVYGEASAAAEVSNNIWPSPALLSIRISRYYHRTDQCLGLCHPLGALYNANKQEGLTKVKWTDMESLHHIHGEEQFFVGQKSTNPDEYLTKFLLYQGVPASVVTGRSRSFDMSRKNIKYLKSHTPIHDVFRAGYQKGETRMN
ncbi:hypothetical protein DER46DRAFT_579278 [Fusarium sp. MPI-SDFR-AT-0072]|nr:hypothetical protein DER46DRAFT_579278 [Fusarium sp. MPI-SDFR-AT-0072]